MNNVGAKSSDHGYSHHFWTLCFKYSSVAFEQLCEYNWGEFFLYLQLWFFRRYVCMDFFPSSSLHLNFTIIIVGMNKIRKENFWRILRVLRVIRLWVWVSIRNRLSRVIGWCQMPTIRMGRHESLLSAAWMEMSIKKLVNWLLI